MRFLSLWVAWLGMIDGGFVDADDNCLVHVGLLQHQVAVLESATVKVWAVLFDPG